MAGIKRRQAEDGSKSADAVQAKKLKSEPSKAEAKFALKLARGSKPKSAPSTDKPESILTVNGKEKTPKADKPKKIESKPTTTPGSKKSKLSKSDDLVESDTTESENGFYGFSANEGVERLAESFDSEAEDELSAEKPAKKAKTEHKAKPQSNGNANGEENANSGNNSRESHIKQKALARERKALKPNADEIQRAKKIWERLRRKSHVPKEERGQLLEELFDIVTGRVKDFVFKHDSVRTIQCALKYSTMAQRRMIAEELKGNYKNLAESRYAKFLIGKLIVEGDDKIRDLIIPEFYGHVRRMINHAEASWILDDIYRGVASKEQKATLLQEFYGPEFALFRSSGEGKPTAELSDILAKSPEKRKPIMDYLHGMINQLIQKKMTGFTMLHDAMLQYFLNVSPGSSEMADYLKLIIGDAKEEEVDLLKNLAFTKPGSRVVCLALAHGTAKDRKLVLRAYVDTVSMLAVDPNGHAVLVTAYEVVDDTRETSKRIFSELVSLNKDATAEGQQEKILPLSDNLIGRIPLLYPFAGAAKWLINKQETQELVKEIISIRTTTSKKAPETRRSELVTALSPPLLTTIADNAGALIQSSYGCQLVCEVLLDAVGDKSAAVSAVAELAGGDPTAEEHISKSATAGRMLKTLIAGGHFNPKEKKVVVTDPNLGFHNQLYKHIKAFIKEWATGESSFVVVALLEADGFEHKAELTKKLTGMKGELEEAASKKAVVAEKEKVDDAEAKSKKRKKSKQGENRAVGNAGSKMLLDILKV